jgi:hypothetical protein
VVSHEEGIELGSFQLLYEGFDMSKVEIGICI